jgi:gluconokinase
MNVVEHFVVMGVAGVGKTTIARAMSDRLGFAFADADDFHPNANLAKMTAGSPLTDADRLPWLRSLRAWMDAQTESRTSTVLACSALRRSYRDILRGADGATTFVHLLADAPTLRARLEVRPDHFMPASLLASQLADLEPLEPDEDGFAVNVGTPPNDVLSTILTRIGARKAAVLDPAGD